MKNNTKLSPIARFEREVIDLLMEVLDITDCSAQRIVEAEGDILMECFQQGTDVRETAEIIANY